VSHVPTPRDALFEFVFGKADNAASELRLVLAAAEIVSFAELVPELGFVLRDISQSDDTELRKRRPTAAVAL
jgi:hypothetical protein